MYFIGVLDIVVQIIDSLQYTLQKAAIITSALDSSLCWLFMCIVWSIDNHGPTQVLVDCLRPLLIKYKVTAYFCGHDHTMQHIHEEDSSVEYFVSGAGHSINPSQTHVVRTLAWNIPFFNILSS